MSKVAMQQTETGAALTRDGLRAIAAANGWLLIGNRLESDWFLHDRSRYSWIRHEVTVFYDEERRPTHGTAVDCWSPESAESTGFCITADRLVAALEREF
ncbi:hypothetical protein [Mycobacteroides abscessus]|uniref:hypothetical protein n=1 Tax=Mycobacteroides abscessus TaxID=36809 RepID=UPI000E691699|nr:hypothetical protein [Mycobacteroides abscessus]